MLKKASNEIYLPKYEGKVMAAGPGLVYSAAIGPRRLVGVHAFC